MAANMATNGAKTSDIFCSRVGGTMILVSELCNKPGNVPHTGAWLTAATHWSLAQPWNAKRGS
jgi:hypothetical protein